ncbi:hypothetical protein QYE79_26815 [Pseudomonas aeruginosa]|nr:hypothetical protein [Pseudomonas aeruginosa]WKA34237.1 hypothetical protein QYE79_26815 [Pseudomonas aeruginosa]
MTDFCRLSRTAGFEEVIEDTDSLLTCFATDTHFVTKALPSNWQNTKYPDGFVPIEPLVPHVFLPGDQAQVAYAVIQAIAVDMVNEPTILDVLASGNEPRHVVCLKVLTLVLDFQIAAHAALQNASCWLPDKEGRVALPRRLSREHLRGASQ